MGRALDCLLGAPWGGSVFANSAKNRGALLTAPFMGRQGPRALAWGAPLDAPWLAPWIALGPRGRRGGAFSGNVVLLFLTLSGLFLTLSSSELSLTLLLREP